MCGNCLYSMAGMWSGVTAVDCLVVRNACDICMMLGRSSGSGRVCVG